MKTRHLRKLVPFMVLSVLLSACKEAPTQLNAHCLLPGEEAPEQSEQDAELPRECAIPEQAENGKVAINALLREFSEQDENKMRKALERLRLVLNSKEFKQRVLDHTYEGEKTFVDNNGLTNEEVYEVIMNGAEDLLPDVDHEADLDITLYHKNNSTVGYTYPNTIRIWVNKKFFANFTLGKVAGNAVHEWTHKLGFGHDFKRTVRRNYSVPYAIGTIVQEMVDSM